MSKPVDSDLERLFASIHARLCRVPGVTAEKIEDLWVLMGLRYPPEIRATLFARTDAAAMFQRFLRRAGASELKSGAEVESAILAYFTAHPVPRALSEVLSGGSRELHGHRQSKAGQALERFGGAKGGSGSALTSGPVAGSVRGMGGQMLAFSRSAAK